MDGGKQETEIEVETNGIAEDEEDDETIPPVLVTMTPDEYRKRCCRKRGSAAEDAKQDPNTNSAENVGAGIAKKASRCRGRAARRRAAQNAVQLCVSGRRRCRHGE